MRDDCLAKDAAERNVVRQNACGETQGIWPCKRLGVPLAFVDQWMANHAQQLLLHTWSPLGEEELDKVRRLVIEAYDPASVPQPLLRPVFV
jgi:hypothetical protein